ncbi:MAG: filamentous hemagglutinin N-terminal domain-containing protein [Chlorobiaceae bacterium]|nr:filamentous hemagglutinin N-terminal domain-containing protein [Chlorobiaceae bacterium]
MNRIHKIVWSAVKDKWIVVSEKAGATGCPIIKVGVLSLAALLCLGTPAFAIAPGELPTGGTITAGSGTIAAAGNAMTVTQTSQKLIADWNTFNIGAQASVKFEQPGATSAALNRIHDLNPTQIMGKLSSNGQVFLLNQSGIIFGKTAQVNVGGLVASSLNMADSDFLAGNYKLTNGGAAGSVVNEGSINALPGGVVALIAPQVENQGTITAEAGSAALLSGNKVTVDFVGDGLISYVVDEGAVNALAANSGLVKADGGLVVMSAEAADELTSAAVNNSGIIEARTLGDREGKIVLLSDMKTGTTSVGGTLDASAPNGGNGGFIETSGANVNIGNDALINTSSVNGNTGTWLLDPVDFIVASSGGNITGSLLGTALASNNVTIHTDAAAADTSTDKYGTSGSGTNGDIFVNDTVTWSSSRTLTLNAYRNIKVNSAISLTGSGTLSLLWGQGAAQSITANTATFTATAPINLTASSHFNTTYGLGGDMKDYTVITTKEELQAMSIAGTNYVLGNDLTLTGSFTPIGGILDNTVYVDAMNSSNPVAALTPYAFKGSFEGAGHTITSLNISSPSTTFVGMFALPFNTTTIQHIENLTISSANVTGELMVGTLAGFLGPKEIVNNVTISNCAVNGQSMVGGLAGGAAGLVENSKAFSVTVTQNSDYNTFSNIPGIGRNNGGREEYGSIGGLLGNIDGATVYNCSVSGTVTALNDSSNIGGLAGDISYSTDMGGPNQGLSYSSSSADVLVGNRLDQTNQNGNFGSVGGLVGGDWGQTISYCYSTGNVTTGWGQAGNYGLNSIGGLVGQMGRREDFPTIVPSVDHSYSTGKVTVGSVDNGVNSGGHVNNVGGLIGGIWGGSVSQSYSTGRVKEFGSNGGNIGGLIGSAGNWNNSSYNSTISNCYSLGNVVALDGAFSVGGFIGSLQSNGSPLSQISYSYSTGLVSAGGGGGIGGFIGQNNGTITNSYWDTETSGIASNGIGSGTLSGANANVTGVSTSQLMGGLQSGWDSGIWGISSTYSFPYFKWQYPSTPEVFSGTLSLPISDTLSGKTIVIAAGGQIVTSTLTAANGFYYTLVPYDTVTVGQNLLIFVNASTYSDGTTPLRANHVTYVRTDEQCTGLGLSGGTIMVTRNSTDAPLFPTIAMNSAIGSLGSNNKYKNDILYRSSGTGSGTMTLNADTLFRGKTATGISITGDVNAAGHALMLMSGGQVIQSAGKSITAGTLILVNEGISSPSFTLTNSGNTFSTLAAYSNGGNILLSDANSTLLIGSASSPAGTIDGVNVGSGTLMLNVPGAVTQSSSAPITAGTLELQGGSFNLGTASNSVGILAGSVTGNVALTDTSALTIGSFTSGLGGTVSGLNAHTASVMLDDSVSIGQASNAPITAATLQLLGGGNFDFTGVANHIGTLAGVANNLYFTNLESIIVGQVNTSEGLTATNSLTIQTTGGSSNITLNKPLSANVLGLSTSGSLSQLASGSEITAGVLELNGSGNFDLRGSNNSIANLFGDVTGNVALIDFRSLNIESFTSLFGGGPVNGLNAHNATVMLGDFAGVTQTAPITAGTLELQGGTFDLSTQANSIGILGGNVTGDVKLNDTANLLTIGSFTSLMDGSTTIAGLQAGAGSTVVLKDLHTVTQTSSAPITAGTLVLIGGTFDLSAASNEVANVAGDTTATSGSISLKGSNSNNLNIASYDGSFGGSGVEINGLATSTGTVTLINKNTVNQSSSILADKLDLLGGGDFVLNRSSNSVGTLAGNVHSASFSNSGDLVIGQVNATSGLTGSGTLELTVAGSQLSLNKGVQADKLKISGNCSVIQSSLAAITANVIDLGNSGNVTLNEQTNQIGILSGEVNGNVSVTNGGSIIIGSGIESTGLAATGTVTVVANGSSADITLDQPVNSNSPGNAVVLAAGRDFVNHFGAGGIILGGGGRWLVYSTNPANDTFGGLNSGNKAVWNATYAGNPPAGVASGNRYLFSLSPTLSVTSTNLTKTYGDDASSSVAGAYSFGALQGNFGGAIVADQIADFGTPTVTSNGSDIYAAVSGSPYTITAVKGSMTDNGYSLSFVSSGRLTVNKADYTGISGTKTYNGSAVFSNVAVAGVNGETFTVASATADIKDTTATHFESSIGTISGTNLHADPNNYNSLVVTNLTGVHNTATINKVTLTLSGSRVYDGFTTFDGVDFGTAGSISTGIGSETIALTGSGTVGFKNVALGAQSLATGGFTLNNGTNGGLAINYQIAASGNTGTFTAKPLTVTGLTADDKVYNGNDTATISGTAVFGGKVDGDELTINTGAITATFSDKNVGNNKLINLAGVVLSGGDASNYTSSGVSGLTASITQAPVTLIGTRTYNGLTSISGSIFGSIITGIGSETVTVTGAGSVGSKDASATPQSLVTTGLSLANGTGGGLGSNYKIATLGNTVVITKADYTAISGSKTYNGNADFSNVTLTGVDGETFTVQTATANGQNVADATYFLSTSGTITGNTGAALTTNYNALTIGNLTGANNLATINKATLTLTGSRAYNGQATFTFAAFTPNGYINGIGSETLRLTGTGSVGSKDVTGSPQLLTQGTLAISNGNGGGLASNYQIAASGNTGNVTKADYVTISGSKTYNGNADFTDVTLTGVASETFTVPTATANSQNVVGATTFIDTSGTITGNTGTALTTNYNPLVIGNLTGTNNVATVTRATVTLTGSRTYDGGTAFSYTAFGSHGVIEGVGSESLQLSGSGSVGSKDVAAGPQVLDATGLTLSNGSGSASNYQIAVSGNTGTIGKANYTTLIGSKSYNGNAEFTNVTLTGVNGETFTVPGATADNKDVATASSFTGTSGIFTGNTSAALTGNYNNLVLGGLTTNTATITRATVTLAGSRVYNGTAAFNGSDFGSVSTGISSEALTLTGAGSVGSKDVSGTPQGLTTGTLALANGTGGGLAANYQIAGSGNTGMVTKADYTAISGSKSYNGNVNFSNVTLTGVNGETFTVPTATANSKDVATASTFTGTGGTITGNTGDALTTNYNSLTIGNLTGANNVATITRATVTLAGSRAYNGGMVFNGSDFGTVNTGVGTETLTLTGAGTVGSKDVSAGSQGLTTGSLALVTATGLSGNYQIAATGNTGTITKAHLTVTADNQSREYGDSNPTLTSVISGFISGENASNIGLTGSASVSTPATATSDVMVAGYAITPSPGGLASPNYDFTTFVPGTLTITRATLTVAGYGGSRLYGGANSTIAYTGTLSGKKFVSDDVSLTSSSIDGSITQASNVNTYNGVLTTGLTGAKAGNYTLASSTGNLTINPAPLGVTANDDSKVYDGSAYSGGNGVTYSGFVNSQDPSVLSGTLAYGGSSQNAVNTGDYVITPSGLTSTNYHITFVDGKLTIQSAIDEPNQVPFDAPQQVGDLMPTGEMPDPLFKILGEDDLINGVTSLTSTDGSILVTITSDQAELGSTFRFVLPEAVVSGSLPVAVTLADGSALPSWLSFNAGDRSFTATGIPAGALPLRLLVWQGGQTLRVEINAAVMSRGLAMSGL